MAKFFSSLTEFCIEELARYVAPDESGRTEGKGVRGKMELRIVRLARLINKRIRVEG